MYLFFLGFIDSFMKLSLYSLDSFIIHIDGGNPWRGPPEFSFGKKPLNKNMGMRGKYLSTIFFHRFVDPSLSNHCLTMTLYPTISIIIIISGNKHNMIMMGKQNADANYHHWNITERQQRKVHHVHVKKPFVG